MARQQILYNDEEGKNILCIQTSRNFTNEVLERLCSIGEKREQIYIVAYWHVYEKVARFFPPRTSNNKKCYV